MTSKQDVIDRIEKAMEFEYRSDDIAQFSDKLGEHDSSLPKHDMLFEYTDKGWLFGVRFVQGDCFHIVSNKANSSITLGVDEFEEMTDKELRDAFFKPIYTEMKNRMDKIRNLR